MLTPNVFFSDVYNLARVGLYRDAAKWGGFCLWRWLLAAPAAVIFAPVAVVLVVSEMVMDWANSSFVAQFYYRLDEKEFAWREDLREKYKQAKEAK